MWPDLPLPVGQPTGDSDGGCERCQVGVGAVKGVGVSMTIGGLGAAEERREVTGVLPRSRAVCGHHAERAAEGGGGDDGWMSGDSESETTERRHRADSPLPLPNDVPLDQYN
jgi:hypothetical protein